MPPIAQGRLAEFGATGADAARGLSLRLDNGTPYTADDFLNQIKFWGMATSFAFVAEPQTNGVAERFNRTLKAPAIHGRVQERRRGAHRRHGVQGSLQSPWRLEKLGFVSSLEARQA